MLARTRVAGRVAGGFGKAVHHGYTSEIDFDGPDEARGIWVMNDYLEWPDDGSGQRRAEVDA